MISQILSPKFYFCAFYHDDNLVVKYTIKPNDSKRGGKDLGEVDKNRVILL